MKPLKEIASQVAPREYFDDPGKDRLLRIVLELAEEVCVLQDRLETVELLARSGQASPAPAINAYAVDDTLMQDRLARHQKFFEDTLRRCCAG